MAAIRKHPVEPRERAVRPYRQSARKPVIAQLARQYNVDLEAWRNWIRQDDADCGARHDSPTTELVEENRRLRAEIKALRPAPAAASVPIIGRSSRHTSRAGCRTTPRAM